MRNDRRRFLRTAVNWRGQVSQAEGPRVAVQVLDVSQGGARLLMPLDEAAVRQDTLDLTAWQGSFWPTWLARRLDVRSQVVRVARHGDCPCAEVGIRFFSPLRRPARRLDLQWLRQQFSDRAAAAPCA